jgi:hypothetical protein
LVGEGRIRLHATFVTEFVSDESAATVIGTSA